MRKFQKRNISHVELVNSKLPNVASPNSSEIIYYKLLNNNIDGLIDV